MLSFSFFPSITFFKPQDSWHTVRSITRTTISSLNKCKTGAEVGLWEEKSAVSQSQYSLGGQGAEDTSYSSSFFSLPFLLQPFSSSEAFSAMYLTKSSSSRPPL